MREGVECKVEGIERRVRHGHKSIATACNEIKRKQLDAYSMRTMCKHFYIEGAQAIAVSFSD